MVLQCYKIKIEVISTLLEQNLVTPRVLQGCYKCYKFPTRKILLLNLKMIIIVKNTI